MDVENKDVEVARCLNCGATLYEGNFCHICGQAANTGRLTTKNMGVVVLSSLTRINKHFLHTVKYLLICPWRVITDYIKGKRVAYTAPVQLLIVLTFLLVVVSPFIGSDIGLAKDYGNVTLLAGENWLVSGVNAVFRTIISSLTLTFLLMLIPAVPVLQLVHRIAGVRKYNLAEYIVGALYVSCFILVIDLVSLPLDGLNNLCLGEKSGLSVMIEGCFVLTILFMTLFKSFASSGKGRLAKILLIVLFCMLCFLFYLFLAVCLYIIHMVSGMIA